jgi:ribose transport system ATP-binding protein
MERTQTSPGDLRESSATDVVLDLRGVSKSYPGVRALRDVSLSFSAGQVHGLVGENGAGKSTLMGVASGATAPDDGTVTLCGEASPGADPRWVREHGLAIVHQEPALLPDLTVAENMRLVMPHRLRPSISRQNQWAREQLSAWDSVVGIAPGTTARRLRPDERFVVEIARALAAQPKVLILDEPTEHLLEAGVRVLFQQLEQCVERGIAVVYISHRIREVIEVSDVVSVLRNGELRGTLRNDDLTEDELVRLIVGREIEARFPDKPPVTDSREVMSVSGLRGETFSDVSFALRRGEILGLAGVEGQGQREVLRALAGLHHARGEVRVDGEQVRALTPSGSVAKGIAYLPNDRHHEGALTGLSVRENIMLRALGAVSRLGVVSRTRERAKVAEALGDFGVRTPSPETTIESLSGGNQQKVMIGRLLLSDASVLVVDEPSQGVDVGARAEIYALLRQATSEGKAVCVLSSDNSELEGLCDRVLVFSRGRIVETLEGDEVEEHRITQAAVTATGPRERQERPAAPGGLRSRLTGRALPWVVLVVAVVALAAAAASKNSFFLTTRNLTLILPMLAVIVLVAFGQQFSLLVGGIDLSVGPLMSTVIVTASFVLAPSVSSLGIGFGLLALLAIALAVGLANWVLISVLEIPPIIATLVTYTALQGVALVIRPTPGGSFSPDVLHVLQKGVGFVPTTVIIAVVVAILLEVALTRTSFGVKLRGAGSNPAVASTVGIRVSRVNLAAYLGSSVFALLAAIVYLPVAGSGIASVGTIYTLSSIAAVVLGGASIFGGRGSFVGAMLGAATVVQINTVVPFLGLTTYWQQYLLGGLTIVATACYSRLGSGGAAGRRWS